MHAYISGFSVSFSMLPNHRSPVYIFHSFTFSFAFILLIYVSFAFVYILHNHKSYCISLFHISVYFHHLILWLMQFICTIIEVILKICLKMNQTKRVYIILFLIFHCIWLCGSDSEIFTSYFPVTMVTYVLLNYHQPIAHWHAWLTDCVIVCRLGFLFKENQRLKHTWLIDWLIETKWLI